MKKKLNQKLIHLVEYYNLINANFLLSNTPIKRTADSFLSTNFPDEPKFQKLNKLKKKLVILKTVHSKKMLKI